MEAHATDEWYVSSINDKVAYHKSMKERVEALKLLQTEYPLHPNISIYLDNIENSFNATYSSWPFRYWVIDENQTIVLKAMPDGQVLHLDRLSQWLFNRYGRLIPNS